MTLKILPAESAICPGWPGDGPWLQVKLFDGLAGRRERPVHFARPARNSTKLLIEEYVDFTSQND